MLLFSIQVVEFQQFSKYIFFEKQIHLTVVEKYVESHDT